MSLSAKSVIMALDKSHREWIVVFMRDTHRPWQYAEYRVSADSKAEACASARARLATEVGSRQARFWRLNDVTRI